MMFARFLIAAIFIIFSSQLFAQSPLTATGFAVYHELSQPRYAVAIYEDEIPQIAEIRYAFLSPLSQRQFISPIIQSAAINVNSEIIEQALPALNEFKNALIIDLKEGDILKAKRLTGSSVAIVLNDIPLTTISSNTLFETLLSVLIGDVPPSSEFKRQLLGQEDFARAQNIFRSTEYSPNRKQVILNTLAASASEEQEKKLLAQQRRQAEARKKAQAQQAKKVRLQREKKQAKQKYLNQLTLHLNEHTQYPRSSKWLKHEGKVRVQVHLDNTGRLIEYQIIEATPYESLNRAAIKALKKASPFPAFPDSVTESSITSTLPVVFSLNTAKNSR